MALFPSPSHELESTFERLTRTSPDDPVWDQLRDFVDRLQRLRELKLFERQSLRVTRAEATRKLILELVRAYDNGLSFHEIAVDVDAFARALLHKAAKDLEEVHQRLVALGELLKTWDRLMEGRPRNVSEQRRKEASLRDISEHILASWTAISQEQGGQLPTTTEVEAREQACIEHQQQAESKHSDESAHRPSDTQRLRAAAPKTADPESTPSEAETEAYELVAWERQQATGSAPPAEDLLWPSDENRLREIPETHLVQRADLTADDTSTLHHVAHEIVACEHLEAIAALVGSGDYASAYWTSFAAVDEHRHFLIPPWLLLACFLSRSISEEMDEASSELAMLITAHPEPLAEMSAISPCDQATLLAVASVRAALISPRTGAGGWLDMACSIEHPYRDVLRSVSDFAKSGVALSQAVAVDAFDATRLEGEITEVRARARLWMERMKTARFSYPPATAVVRDVASGRSELGKALTAVAEDTSDHQRLADEVLSRHLASRRAIVDFINRIAKDVSRAPKPTPITGSVLESLVTRFEEAASILSDWLAIAGVGRVEKAGWRENNLRMLRAGLAALSEEYSCQDDLTGCYLNALYQELVTLRRGLLEDPALLYPEEKRGRNWHSILVRPLLALDSPPIEQDDLLPAAISPTDAVEVCRTAWKPPAVDDLLQKHISSGHFIAAQMVLDLAKDQHEHRQGMSTLDEALREGASRLRRLISDARSEIEQSLLIHVISDSERTDYEAELLAIEQEICGRHYRLANLEERVNGLRGRLRELRGQRSASLAGTLSELTEDLADLGDVLQGRAHEFFEKAGAALQADDLYLAAEYISRLDQLIAGDTVAGPAPPPPSLARPLMPSDIEVLSKHLSDLQQAADLRKAKERIAKGQSLPGLDLQDIPEPRLREAKTAIDAFASLRRNTRETRPKTLEVNQLTTLLSYFGFVDPTLTRLADTRMYWHFTASMSDGGQSPLPQYGTARNGSYDVVLVWDRPAAETIGQILQTIGVVGKCPIVIFMGRLTPMQREEWARYCYGKRLTALMIDETIVWYLSGCRQSRLPSCVATGLTWGYSDPYTPFASGSVPSEMFMGRYDTLVSLQDPFGSTILYGGRQLGKSAILRRVQAVFHRPSDSQYALYQDIKGLGDPLAKQRTDEVWQYIRDWAVREKLISSQVLARPENVARELLATLHKTPEMRIIVLLDEADNFLAADASGNFAQIEGLKRIMDGSGRRFKVVFSGLHGVQRFCSLPNHPFANMGKPINIGPLEPPDARALITYPLGVLGFAFDGDEPVDRILAYTNYHPALIQHFCSQMVRKRPSQRPPWRVTTTTVEDVYRDPEVLRVIRERFEWTVGLDTRYQAIVYAMVLDQLDARDGYRKTYTAQEALELAASWWIEGFAGVGLEDVQSLLEELVGLGVLVRNAGGGFRIRNLNVVTALGSRSDIWTKMDSVLNSPPPMEYDPKIMRAVIDEGADLWSPLSLEQEGHLLKRQTALFLVHGSRALGMDVLGDRLSGLLDGGSTAAETRILKLPPDCLSLDALHACVDRNIPKAGKLALLLTGSHLLAFSEGPALVIDRLSAMMQRRQARNRFFLAVIKFSGADLREWYKQPTEVRENLQARAQGPLQMTTWGARMIESCLKHYGALANPSSIQAVLDCTGGWPFLITELLSRMRRASSGDLANHDPRELCVSLRAELETKEGFLRRAFLAALEMESIPLGRYVAQQVRDFGALSEADLVDTLVAEGKDEIDAGSCIAALKGLCVIREHRAMFHLDPVVCKVLDA